MSESELAASEAFDSLVTQFSAALSCYRELVQNSIDAGSPRVEVWLQFIPGTGNLGTIAIHVDDFGEGMDEAIIHNELCRLFSSSKEGDLTKIGKFGIGFVSVFAMKPRTVLLHTGRGGQFFEVLFREDRSYTCERIQTPVEGTQVTLFLDGDRYRYQELVSQSRQALSRWCRYTEAEVTFEDRSDTARGGPKSIREDFTVPGDCLIRQEHQGTEIVLAYNSSPGYGFFNKGLTLLETVDAEEALGPSAFRFRHIAFKIKSRYLEHTLSRETILKDENYVKAVELLKQAADGPLRDSLLAELESLAASGRFLQGDRDRYLCLLSYLAEEPASVLPSLEKRKILRSIDSIPLCLADLRVASQRDGRVFISAERSEITVMLGNQKVPVLLGILPATVAHDQEEPIPVRRFGVLGRLWCNYLAAWEKRGLLGTLSEKWGVNLRASILHPSQWSVEDRAERIATMLADPHQIFHAVEVDRHPSLLLAPLLTATGEALHRIGAGYARITSCTLRVPEVHPPLFVVGRRIAPLMCQPPKSVASPNRRLRPVAAVNRDHPQLQVLQQVYRHDPALAIYALAKDLLLAEDRLLMRDTALMAAAFDVVPEQSPLPR